MKGLAACLLLALLCTAPDAVSRETVTIRFEAEVTGITEFSGVFDLSERIAIGERVSGSFSYNPDLPATRQPPSQAWGGSIVGWSVTISGETLSGRRGSISRNTEFPPDRWFVRVGPETDTVYLGNRYVDAVTLSWPAQSNFSPVLPRGFSLQAPGTFYLGFTSGAVGAVLEARLLQLTGGESTVDSLGSQTVWQARPEPGQAPHDSTPPTRSTQSAALWFDSSQEVATLSITDPNSSITLPRLHCGIAGASGPLVWQASTLPTGREKHWQLDRFALLQTAGECDHQIRTIAGLRRAAEDRILYVEYEADGILHRGQLWPRALMADQNLTASALATAAQVVDSNGQTSPSKLVARLRLSDQGGIQVHYFLDDANVPGRLKAATLHCGPPGAIGPIVAELRLTPNAAWNSLARSSLSPVTADSACGFEINNSASLVEAYLRGLLYFRLEGAGGEIWRGQAQLP